MGCRSTPINGFLASVVILNLTLVKMTSHSPILDGGLS